MGNRISGIIQVAVDGETFPVKGSWTYGYGYESRETIVGSDRIHGFKTNVTVPFLEGTITDDGTIDIQKLSRIDDATITMRLGNGKIFVLRNAWHTNPDGISGSTEESEISVRFEGKSAEDVSV